MIPPADPLSRDQREHLLRAPRPRVALPLLGKGERQRPELRESRARDQRLRPRHAVWEVTLRCDQACRHCGSRAAVARPDELSTAECLELITQLAELGVMEVTLIGGEAYLRPDFLELVAAIHAAGMQCTMTTGGRTLGPELARAAKQAGLSSASVSLDGEATVHDRLRGARGSHAAALAALRALREAGVRTTINSQINRLSMPDLPAMVDTLVREQVEAWQIMLTVPMGRAADEPEVLLQPYDLLTLFPMLDALAARCERERIRLYPGNNLGYFGPYESRLRGSTRHGHGRGCSAGLGTLGIEADGTIKGCPSLPTLAWAGGSVREHSLRELWERSARLRYMRDRTVEDLSGYCRDCYYADVCRGGCTWTAFTVLGHPGNNPYCHHRALEHASRGMRERIVQRQAAPGEPFDHGVFEILLEPTPEEPHEPTSVALSRV